MKLHRCEDEGLTRRLLEPFTLTRSIGFDSVSSHLLPHLKIVDMSPRIGPVSWVRAGGASTNLPPASGGHPVTGHIGFPRLVDGSSQRDWSNWPAFRIHRYVRERDRILTRVDTGGIPDQGGKAIWSARQKGRAVFAFYSPGPPLGSFTKEMQAFRFFCVGKQTALPRLGNCGRAW